MITVQTHPCSTRCSSYVLSDHDRSYQDRRDEPAPDAGRHEEPAERREPDDQPAETLAEAPAAPGDRPEEDSADAGTAATAGEGGVAPRAIEPEEPAATVEIGRAHV